MFLSSDEDSDKEVAFPKKSLSSNDLPKIKLHQRVSTGDPEISCKAMEITLFNSSASVGNTTKINSSTMLKDQPILESNDESEIEVGVGTEAQLAAAANSLINSSKRFRTQTPQKSPSLKTSTKSESENSIVRKSSLQVHPDEDQVSEIEDTAVENSSGSETETYIRNKSLNKSKEKSVQISSSDEEMEMQESMQSESEKRKRRRRTAGFDESLTEEQPVKKSKLNVSLVSDKKLDTILEKCNEILKSKKEEKKKNKLLHKKDKVKAIKLVTCELRY